jgi:hypothetical protein
MPHRALVGAVVILALLAATVTAVLLVARGGSDGGDQTAGPTGSRSTRPSATTTPAGNRTSSSGSTTVRHRLRIADVSPYDPDGDGTENPAATGEATDGDPATAWTTDRYATATLGGLKPGVGLLLDMGGTTTVRGVRVTFGVAGSSVRLYVGSAPDKLLGGTPVAARSDAPPAVTLRPRDPASGRYVLVWLTALPHDPGGGYRGQIAEVTVAG